MDTAQLPFCLGSLFGGCVKIDGIMKAGPEHLTLEYRMSDNLLGAWTGAVTTRAVAYCDLEHAEFRAGFFAPRLILTARSMQLFDKLPMSAPAQLSLSVPWKHRHQLRAFASEINLYLSYHAADRHRRERLEGI
jgi:hypothetical protein